MKCRIPNFLFTGSILIIFASLGFAVCNGRCLTAIKADYARTLALSNPGGAQRLYDCSLALVIIGPIATLFMIIGLVLTCLGFDKSECWLGVAMYPGPLIFVGCMVSAGFIVTRTIDPRPLSLIVLEERNFDKRDDIQSYLLDFYSMSIFNSRTTRGRRIASDNDPGDLAIEDTCKARLSWRSKSGAFKRLAAASYQVGFPKQDFDKPFLLSKDPEAADVTEHIETGHSEWYWNYTGSPSEESPWVPHPSPPVEERYDLLWDIWDLPAHWRTRWSGSIGKSGACHIQVEDGRYAPDVWEDTIEDFICRAYRACEAELEKEREQDDARRERLSKLGAVQADNVTAPDLVPGAWMLPVGWDNFGAVKEYYRQSAVARLDESLTFDALCRFAFNVCFMIAGGIGWLFVVVCTSLVCCGADYSYG
jgi:hypothetical protein